MRRILQALFALGEDEQQQPNETLMTPLLGDEGSEEEEQEEEEEEEETDAEAERALARALDAYVYRLAGRCMRFRSDAYFGMMPLGAGRWALHRTHPLCEVLIRHYRCTREHAPLDIYGVYGKSAIYVYSERTVAWWTDFGCALVEEHLGRALEVGYEPEVVAQ
jgi:hypothetical protein